MPIGFRTKNLSIETFRGLRDLQVDFPGDSPLYLIGTNNACKSTVLEAVAMALAGPSFYNYACDRFDFFHSADGQASRDFTITVGFKPIEGARLPVVRGSIGTPVYVFGSRARGRTDKNGRLSHDIQLLNRDHKEIVLACDVPLKATAATEFKEQGSFYGRPYARWTDVSEYRPDVWHLKPSNLYVSLYEWKTGPLHRLATMLAKRFFESNWEFEWDGGKRSMPETIRKAHQFFSSSINAFPFWKDDLKPKLEDTLSTYVGRHARIDLRHDIRAVEEWLRDQLVIAFAAEASGVATPLKRMGDGWQSLVRIAALDVLSQYPDQVRDHVVLLFEEPESFLHPHLAKKLGGVLERLAGGGWTVAATTHSPSLVSFSGSQHITRLQRDGEVISQCTLAAAEVDGAAKLQERLDDRGAHEFLFARKVVFCEGEDDVFALRGFLEGRHNDDLDGQSFSLIQVGGVGTLPAFAAMASRLGICWYVLVDEDLDDDGNVQPKTQQAKNKVMSIKTATDCIGIWPGNLEGCLKTPAGKAKPEWQAHHIMPKSMDDLRRECPDYVTVCEDIRTWLAS